MAITVTLHQSEAVFTCGALESSIEKLRQFCRDTDAQYGDMNNVQKRAIAEYLGAHRSLIVALRAEGYLMTGRDVAADPIDKEL